MSLPLYVRRLVAVAAAVLTWKIANRTAMLSFRITGNSPILPT
jgi:hypothetical protein